MDLRKALFGNIVLSGGSTLTRGMLYSASCEPCPRGQKCSTRTLYMRYYARHYVRACSTSAADRVVTTHRIWRPPSFRGTTSRCQGYENQNICATRAEIQHVDWRVYSGGVEHV